jgi:hypothetical protein
MHRYANSICITANEILLNAVGNLITNLRRLELKCEADRTMGVTFQGIQANEEGAGATLTMASIM